VFRGTSTRKRAIAPYVHFSFFPFLPSSPFPFLTADPLLPYLSDPPPAFASPILEVVRFPDVQRLPLDERFDAGVVAEMASLLVEPPAEEEAVEGILFVYSYSISRRCQ
jgi:hypothetical protein